MQNYQGEDDDSFIEEAEIGGVFVKGGDEAGETNQELPPSSKRGLGNDQFLNTLKSPSSALQKQNMAVDLFADEEEIVRRYKKDHPDEGSNHNSVGSDQGEENLMRDEPIRQNHEPIQISSEKKEEQLDYQEMFFGIEEIDSKQQKQQNNDSDEDDEGGQVEINPANFANQDLFDDEDDNSPQKNNNDGGADEFYNPNKEKNDILKHDVIEAELGDLKNEFNIKHDGVPKPNRQDRQNDSADGEIGNEDHNQPDHHQFKFDAPKYDRQEKVNLQEFPSNDQNFPENKPAAQQQQMNSYQNYQVLNAMRAAERKKQNMIKQKKEQNKNKKVNENLRKHLEIDDEIGEVGEWESKSANVNRKRQEGSDDEDDYEETGRKQEDDEFDQVFENDGDDAGANENQKSNPTNTKQTKENLAAVAEARNKAIMKSQNNSSLKKNQGFMLNNLKEKAKNISNMPDKVTPASSKNFQQDVIAEKGEEKKEMAELKETPQPDDESDDKRKSKDNSTAHSESANTKEETKQDEKKSKQKQKPKNALDQQKIEEEVDWEAISKQNLQKIKEQGNKEDSIKTVEFDEAWKYFSEQDLSDQIVEVQKDIDSSKGFFGRLLAACGAGGLNSKLTQERNQYLALAKIKLEDHEDMTYSILRTLYVKAIGKETNVPRFGGHWEKIGFQGRDPATDVRSTGITGLLHLLALASTKTALYQDMYKVANHEQMNFPLAVTMLEFSMKSLVYMREGKINSKINAAKSSVEACNNMFLALADTFFQLYKEENCTIIQLPVIRKDVLDNCAKSVGDFYDRYMRRQAKREASAEQGKGEGANDSKKTPTKAQGEEESKKGTPQQSQKKSLAPKNNDQSQQQQQQPGPKQQQQGGQPPKKQPTKQQGGADQGDPVPKQQKKASKKPTAGEPKQNKPQDEETQKQQQPAKNKYTTE